MDLESADRVRPPADPFGRLWIGSHWLSTVIPISDFSLADYFGYFGTSVQTSLNMMTIGGPCLTPAALVKLGR
jgi:hypothetical protein